MTRFALVSGFALLSTGSAFVQPGVPVATSAPQTATPARILFTDDGSDVRSEAFSSSTMCSLFAGAALGLAVGLAGLAAPASAADAPAPPVPDRCILTEGCRGEQLEAWAKAKAKEINTQCADFDPSKSGGQVCADAKFQKATTGAGRYKEFKMDYANPNSFNGYSVKGAGTPGQKGGGSDAAGGADLSGNGFYSIQAAGRNKAGGAPFAPQRGGGIDPIADYRAQPEVKAFRERIQPLIDGTKYSNTYSAGVPYKWQKSAFEMK